MAHGLPRRIKLAFITQALIGSIVITVGILLTGIVVRQKVVEQRVEQEARAFWQAYADDPSHRLPLTVSGVFAPPSIFSSTARPS